MQQKVNEHNLSVSEDTYNAFIILNMEGKSFGMSRAEAAHLLNYMVECFKNSNRWERL